MALLTIYPVCKMCGIRSGHPWGEHAIGDGDIREGHGACEGDGGGEEEEQLEEGARGEAEEGWL